MWQVEYTREFEDWWDTLDVQAQATVGYGVELLQSKGPQLHRPHVDHIKGSRHANMKELRSQYQGQPIRTFFAFDPRRSAILLIGGDKSGDAVFMSE